MNEPLVLHASKLKQMVFPGVILLPEPYDCQTICLQSRAGVETGFEFQGKIECNEPCKNWSKMMNRRITFGLVFVLLALTALVQAQDIIPAGCGNRPRRQYQLAAGVYRAAGRSGDSGFSQSGWHEQLLPEFRPLEFPVARSR
jgi:hypothetical protein